MSTKVNNKISDSKTINVISGAANFVTTAKKIRDGIGSSADFNYALRKTLNDLEDMYKENRTVFGLVQKVNGISVQLNIL